MGVKIRTFLDMAMVTKIKNKKLASMKKQMISMS